MLDPEALEGFPQVPYDGEPDGLEEAIEEEEWSPTTEKEPNSPSGELDHVRQYLREIGSYPLLSLEEEIELARLILEGQEAAEALARSLGVEAKEVSQLALARILERVEDLPSGLLLLEERIKGDPRLKRLYQRVREGERARRDMVNANLRLVVSVAKRFTRKADKLHLLDLIQEGNRGLIRATYTFDYRKGYKFSTYATWWIRQAINRAIADQGRTVRLPVHFHESWQKLKAAQLTLEKELGRAPQAEELAALMGEGWDAKRVEEVLALTQNVYSLDEPVGDDKDSLYGDFLTDESLPHPEDRAMQNAMLERVQKLLEVLDPRQRMVILLRTGILDGRERTLEEVGKELGVTRERVRQIERRALSLLRAQMRYNPGLREFLV
ncbi:MAG: sigma-70 family RNA polymerase sigma factor [Meiothermus ruber]|nr:sigma-70 family RNA polymerase sigma factor [Meiothermus ruber]